MKNKKVLLLILVTLLFSGCTVDYNLYINEDLSVNEKVTATETSKNLRIRTKQEPSVAANSLFELYKIEDTKYSFSTQEKDSGVVSVASTSFSSLEEYENYFKSDIVKDVNITKKGNLVTIEFKQDIPLTNEEESRSLVYDYINVGIDVPFLVTDCNADRVSGNTYIWNIEKNGKKRDIKITFNTKETKDSKKVDFGMFEVNIKYSVLVIAGFAIVIGTIVFIVYLNNKKNNKF